MWFKYVFMLVYSLMQARIYAFLPQQQLEELQKEDCKSDAAVFNSAIWINLSEGDEDRKRNYALRSAGLWEHQLKL